MEDYFVYYVHIVGISEELFWNADISFLDAVEKNLEAYNSWRTYVKERMLENNG